MFFFKKNTKRETSKKSIISKKNYKRFFILDSVLFIQNKTESNYSSLFYKNREHAYLIGTVMYKMHSFDKVLNKIHKDFINGVLDTNQLSGNFIIIFWNDENIYILNDKLGVLPIYFDDNEKCYSSSFLFLLRNSKQKLKINYDAFYEKLATGFILGEDTLFENIFKITPKSEKRYINHIHWVEHKYEDICCINLHSNGKSKSIDKQIEQLGFYFENVNALFPNSVGDLGLSSGFDCRLILGLAEKHIRNKLHLHSHNTIGVHDIEIKYAKQLAKKYGSELNLVPTKRLEDYDGYLVERILKDNFVFFDGTSARHLGAFSETYTYDYKKDTLGEAKYSLNGLGGEIYRDSYFTGKEKMNWYDWINRYVYFPFSLEAVGTKKQLNRTSDYIRYKLEKELDLNYDKMDIFSTHAYYGLIKMPQCNGSVAAAYGKVSPFLFPFIEYDNIIEALKAVPYLGIGGQYQAEMINKISPGLARVDSHYGFSYNKLSYKYFLWSTLKSLGSARRRNNLVRSKLGKQINSLKHEQLISYINGTDILKASKETLLNFSPNSEFDVLLLESTQKRYIIYLAFMLNNLIDLIDF